MQFESGGTFTTPATPMQESVWWVHQRARNKSLYNLTWRLACDRPVDFDALMIAWQAMVDRHEALRTSVTRAGDTVQLTVRSHAVADVGRIEVSDVGSADADALRRLIAEELQESPIDLERPSLARLVLVRVGDRHELVLTVHHVMLDGWGVQLLVTELSAAYVAAVAGDPPRFPEQPVPFHDYVEDLLAAGADRRWQRGIDYWRRTLEGAVATTLVADRQTAHVVAAPGTTIWYGFSEQASAGIRELSQEVSATPFAVVLGAMGIVLARGGAGPDVTVGVAAANRISVRDQNLVGYTANLCISRATVAGSDTIADVIAHARDRVWEMLAHQAVPYPAVFGALSPATQSSLTDAAPIMLSYLGPIGHGLRLGDVELSLLRTPNRAARADVAMSVSDLDGGHRAEIEFNTARYDHATVVALLEDLDRVLALGGREPDRPVDSVSVRSRSTRSGLTPPSPQPPAAAADVPESAIWVRVSDAWTELLGSPPSGPDADFFAAGGHSLSVVRLAAALEQAVAIEIDVVDWLGEPTPRRLVLQLTAGDAELNQTSGSTVVQLRDGDGPHLHLVHGAGGGPRDYRQLVAALPERWRVTASQERDPLTSVPAMADRYRADLNAQSIRPDVIGGWSMGGQVAFEIAAGYETPPALVIVDSTPPTGREPDADLSELHARSFATAVCASFGVEGEALPEVVGSVEVRMGVLAAYLNERGHEVSATALREQWQTYERHARAAAQHVASGLLDATALIVGADLLDEQLAQWAALADPASRRMRLAADHNGVLIGDVAGQLAAAIDEFERELTVSRPSGGGTLLPW
jgi:thioesterase domain-containing protein